MKKMLSLNLFILLCLLAAPLALAEDPDKPADGFWMPAPEVNSQGSVIGVSGVNPPARPGHNLEKTKAYITIENTWDDGVVTTTTVHICTVTSATYAVYQEPRDLETNSQVALASGQVILPQAIIHHNQNALGDLWNETIEHLYRVFDVVYRSGFEKCLREE